MAEMTVELNQLMKLTNFELFDFEYTFDDLVFKKEIEQAIIDYYFFYEIGQETPDRFKHVFKTRFLRMIEYYNKLHNTTLLTYNPLINYSINEALEQLGTNTSKQNLSATNLSNGASESTSGGTNSTTGTNTNTTTNNLTATNSTTGTSTTDDKASDYPQQNIATGDYLSGSKESKGSSTNTGNSTNTGTVKTDGTTGSTGSTNTTGTDTSTITGEQQSENLTNGSTNTSYQKTIEGLTGTSYQELIFKERSNLIRIKNMVINELKPCFYLVY